MSGDWAKVELNTPDKPEIWLIADLLDIDPDAAFGKVFRVWAWFDVHTEDGNAPSVTKRLLDRLVGVTGFCDAMLHAHWMHEENGVIALTNFDKHNGNTAKKRANTSRRVAQHRENKGNAQCNAEGVTEALAREEKRREESNNKKTQQKSVQDPEVQEQMHNQFEQFWCAGMRKVNKKRTQPLFEKILQSQSDPQEFTDKLVQDIKNRLERNQLGFDSMHPTTYLNGERWNDDLPIPQGVIHANGHPSNQQFPGKKLSTIDQSTAVNRAAYERTQREIEELEAQINNAGAVANANS